MQIQRLLSQVHMLQTFPPCSTGAAGTSLLAKPNNPKTRNASSDIPPVTTHPKFEAMLFNGVAVPLSLPLVSREWRNGVQLQLVLLPFFHSLQPKVSKPTLQAQLTWSRSTPSSGTHSLSEAFVASCRSEPKLRPGSYKAKGFRLWI